MKTTAYRVFCPIAFTTALITACGGDETAPSVAATDGGVPSAPATTSEETGGAPADAGAEAPPPADPFVDKFTAQNGDGQVTLEWDGATTNESYDLLIRTEVTSGIEPETLPSGRLQYVVAGLTNGEIYQFQVIAHAGAKTMESTYIASVPLFTGSVGLTADAPGLMVGVDGTVAAGGSGDPGVIALWMGGKLMGGPAACGNAAAGSLRAGKLIDFTGFVFVPEDKWVETCFEPVALEPGAWVLRIQRAEDGGDPEAYRFLALDVISVTQDSLEADYRYQTRLKNNDI